MVFIKKDSKSGVINKAFKVIEAFVDVEQEWGVRELAKHLGMPVATVHRLIYQLQDEGIVEFNPNINKYSIGIELIRIGSKVSQNVDIKKIVRPFLEELVAKHKETVCLVLYAKEKRRIIWVDKVNGPAPLQYVISMGELQPVPYGSSGKSILAYLDPSEIEVICKEEGFTDSQFKELLKELQQIREDGVSSTISERLQGSKGFASPIFNSNDEPVGSLVFTAPTPRVIPQKEAEISMDIKNSAMRISEILGAKSTYK